MIYSTLYYKIGFVLDALAQLSANVRVPSTFKGDCANLECVLGEVNYMHFLLKVFSVYYGFIGM